MGRIALLQTIKDLRILLKSDRRIYATAGFLLAVLVFWMLTNDRAPKSVRMKPSIGSHNFRGKTDDTIRDLTIAYGNRIEKAETERKELFSVLQRFGNNLNNHKTRVTGIIETIVDRLEHLSNEVNQLALMLRNQEDRVPPIKDMELVLPDTLVEIPGPDLENDIPPEQEPYVQVSVITPGDSATVELLTGVNAPTGGEPYPVMFKLTGPVSGPDGSHLELGEARLIATAHGSSNDSRVFFRLFQLAMRHPSGRREVVDIDGWIVGEDGMRGMNGKLESKLVEFILTTLGTTAVSALGERLEEKTKVRVERRNGLNLETSDLEYPVTSAFRDASSKLTEALLEQFGSMVPVIEVLSGRRVVAVFSRPAEIAVMNQELLRNARG